MRRFWKRVYSRGRKSRACSSGGGSITISILRALEPALSCVVMVFIRARIIVVVVLELFSFAFGTELIPERFSGLELGIPRSNLSAQHHCANT